MVKTLQYRPHTPVSLSTLVIPLCELITHTGSGEMAGVACTHPADNRPGRGRVVEYCAPRWCDPVHVLEDPSEG